MHQRVTKGRLWSAMHVEDRGCLLFREVRRRLKDPSIDAHSVAVKGVRLVSVSPLDLDWRGTASRMDDPEMVMGSETTRKPVPREGNFSVVGTPGKSCDRHVGTRKLEFIPRLEFSYVEINDVR